MHITVAAAAADTGAWILIISSRRKETPVVAASMVFLAGACDMATPALKFDKPQHKPDAK